MRMIIRGLSWALAGLLCVAVVSCSSGSSVAPSSSSTTPPASNVVSVVVNGGPTQLSSLATNTLYTTVTVCAPGSTTECQTLDNIQVDTQSYGLRLLAQVLTISLPVITDSSGNALVECTQFVDGYSWGPVATADVQVSGETATSVPVQVIGSSNFTIVPSACSSTGTQEDTVAVFGANGIIGIGNFPQDCGEACVQSAAIGDYYSCAGSACNPTTVALASQVTNPVTLFATDNNGTVIILPSVPEEGAASVTGSLIFGIDTKSNNASGSQTVFTEQGSTDSYPGDLSTIFLGQTLSQSFIDSGSNGLFFNDSSIATCTSADFPGFYCPASAMSLSATVTGMNAASASVSFTVGNAQEQADANPSFTAFATLAGTYPSSDTFDWGMPFFYGRTVYNAIEGYATKVGSGPYIAF